LTLDDCLSEEKRIFEQEGQTVSLSKPNPFMLDAIVKKCRQPFDRFYYVGDMPDDMVAAARSKTSCKGIGILLSAPDKESLKENLIEAGAHHIVDSFEALKEIIL
jgi:phosphoglycolate phosphatase-like HAD superfamily hydrolase